MQHGLKPFFCLLLLASGPVGAGRVFNVKDYGALGNGTNNDTVAIQAALDAAADTFNVPDGAERSGVALIFPAGTYVITNRLNLITMNNPAQDGGIMIRGEGRTNTIIQSGGTNGALRLRINVDGTGSYNIQIEDLAFKAAGPKAGPAIEVAPYIGAFADPEENNLRVTPILRNVTIAQTAPANYYSYGFKGSNLRRPLIDDVTITGKSGSTEAGIRFDKTYAHNIKDCAIDGAKIGVDHYIGGEGNMFNRMTITNVATGIRVENVLYHVYMSGSGGSLLHSTISASECGVSLKHKSYCFVSDNQFNMLAGGTAYTDVKLTDCNRCFITGNSFSGTGTNRTGVSLIKGIEKLSAISEIIVADNTFGSFSTGVSVSSGVVSAMIFNNAFSTVTPLSDAGTSTRFITGTPDKFVSPAATKDTETFSWGNMANMGTVFNVTNPAYSGGAKGDGVTDDTAAIQAAADALVTGLNGSSTNQGILYFPAGTYKLTGQISIAPANGKRVTIHGDGMQVSVIARDSGDPKGVFKLDFTARHTRTDIHNLMIVANYADAGDGICIKQPGAPDAAQARNLYVHNVLMETKLNTYYFSNSINGQYLARPFFENVFIAMYRSAEEKLTGTTGVLLKDIWGFECDKLMVSGSLGTGLDVTSRGGDVLVKNTTGCVNGSAVGARINAGGGRVAIEAAHFAASVFNLDITNATGVSFVNAETLSTDVTPVAGQATVRLTNCRDVEIRNDAFAKSAPLFFNPERRSVWLDGTANSNINIYGNMFLEPGATGIFTQPGAAGPNVRYNRFSRTDVDDLAGPVSETNRLYELNGEISKDYLLKSKVNGKYLNADGTNVACSKTEITDEVLWTVIYDRPSDSYTLTNKKQNKLLRRNGSLADCAGTNAVSSTLWSIVNRGDGLYNLANGSRLLDYDATDLADCSETTDMDDTRWEMILAEDLLMGMDKDRITVPVTTGTDWWKVEFEQPFHHPPAVFAGGPSCNDIAPLTVRVRNVTTNGFEFQLDEWDCLDGNHGAEEVSFIALHKGSYPVNKRFCEAGTITAGTNWVTRIFNVPFPAVPCVFAQCASVNEASAVCTRIRNVTTNSFEVRIQEQAAQGGGSHAAEAVDFIAIDPGGDQYFEVGRTNQCVDTNWKSLTFPIGGWSNPGFVGSVQSSYDNDPCALRYQTGSMSKTNVAVKVDEDNSDGETSHSFEDTGWMVFQSSADRAISGVTQYKLAVETSRGTASPAVGTNTYGFGTTLTAALNGSPEINGTTQYACRGWSGTGSVPPGGTSTNTGSFTLTANSTISWLWTTNYWLDTATNGNGSMSITDSWQTAGCNITITATPDATWLFTAWSGNTNGCTISGNVITVPMTAPRALTAGFATNSNVWKTDAGGSWTTATNWTGGSVPGIAGGSNSTDIAAFATALTTNRTVTADANRNIGGITFANPANHGSNDSTSVGYKLSGGIIKLSNGGVIQVTDQSGTNSSEIASAISIQGNGGSATFRNDATGKKAGLLITGSVYGNSTTGNTTTVYLDGASTSLGNGPTFRNNTIGVVSNGPAGGKVKLVKNGTGVWTVGLSSPFTGGFEVNAGTVRYFSSGDKGFGNGFVTIADGVTFYHANSGAVTITNPVIVNGNITFSGPDNATWSGAMDFNAAVRTITTETAGSTNFVLSGRISNGGLIKDGDGPMILSGTNTHTGGTTVSTGVLIGTSDGALGAGNVTVAGGATLTLSATNCLGDQAGLILATNATLNLTFSGTDMVSRISLNSGAGWLPYGHYTAVQLAALGGGTYTGSGLLFVEGFATDPAHTPYSWLAQYGLTNFNADAIADADHDGLLTWQEYIAGTNPTNPASVFKITGNDVTSQGSVIRWSSVSNRFYSLSRTTNLMAAFAAVAGASNLPATPPENVFTNPAQNGNVTFYRISVHQ